jgi:hypothetical protein
MMKNRQLSALLFILTLITVGCSSIETRHDFDPEANFGGYQSFSWVATNPLMASSPNTSPLAGQRIQRAVLQNMTAKGYRFVDDLESADFVVGFTVGTRDQVRITNTLQPIGMTGFYGRGMMYQNDIDVREYTEGQLAIDIYDIALKRPVWHGVATKDLSVGDMQNPEQTVNEAVKAILDDFPPQ